MNKLEKMADVIIGVDSLGAAQLKERIDSLIKEISDSQYRMSKNFVTLGNALLKARQSRAYQEWGFPSWGAYIDDIRTTLDSSRSRLYGIVSVAEKLLPSVSEAQLETMGITKALELKKAARDGNPPSERLIDAALNPEVRVSQLRAEIHKDLHLPEPERGMYYDWGGFYLTPDEKETVESAIRVTEEILGLKKETPEHVRRKEVVLAWAQEFLSNQATLEESRRGS